MAFYPAINPAKMARWSVPSDSNREERVFETHMSAFASGTDGRSGGIRTHMTYRFKRRRCAYSLRSDGGPRGIRTLTPKHWLLRPACLPFHHRAMVPVVGFEPTLSRF